MASNTIQPTTATKEVVINAATARSQMANKNVCLVTGGSGYIGSHTVLELLCAGWSVVVIDNLYNSHVESLYRTHYLMREYYSDPKLAVGLKASDYPQLHFIKADVRREEEMQQIFSLYNSTTFTRTSLQIVDIGANRASYRNASLAFDSRASSQSLKRDSSQKTGRITHVIHFAALKAVGESVSMPLAYYKSNVGGLLNVLGAMDEFQVKNIVFSSSAVVYGSEFGEYISEDMVSTGGKGHGGGLLTNPYGRSKWMDEEILSDWSFANKDCNVIALRYFNPTGCHPSGLIGEDPGAIPTNLMPIVLQTFQRRRSKVQVFGADYSTKDGSGVRDFIHVMDLAAGHVAAINKLVNSAWTTPQESDQVINCPENYNVYNLGTGTGYSVLEIIKAFATETGVDIPYQQGERRSGDLGEVTANPSKAKKELGWSATYGLQSMCADLVKWANKNPNGYAYERLRKLSTVAAENPNNFMNNARRASVNRRASTMVRNDSGIGLDPLVEEAEPEDIVSLVKELVLDDNLYSSMTNPISPPPQWGHNPFDSFSIDTSLSHPQTASIDFDRPSSPGH